MDVGQALVNERTFDLSVHMAVYVCVCYTFCALLREN